VSSNVDFPTALPEAGVRFDICGVYAIRHEASGRVYVGSSANIVDRWRSHCRALIKGRHHSRHLQRAWIKYGAEAFAFVVLERCRPHERLVREQHYIDACCAHRKANGFNVSARADTPSSTPEVAAKIARALLGKPLSLKHRESLRRAWMTRMGHKHSDETKKRMSAAAFRRRSPSIEARAKMSLAARRRPATFLGKTHSLEARKKIAEATRRQWARADMRAKLIEARVGRVCSEATRVKMRESQRNRRIAERAA